MAQQETFVSTDIESDGPIPGVNSLLSFASVALDGDGREQGELFVNIRRDLEGAAS